LRLGGLNLESHHLEPLGVRSDITVPYA
jgi:hypothetical protein